MRRLVVLILLLMLAGCTLAWLFFRPIDTTSPQVTLDSIQPDRPLFADDKKMVTFVLEDAQGNIPTFFLFTGEDQTTTAMGINAMRGTPNDQGVEIRFEAIRFRRDEQDADRLWVRAVGIVNELEGKTPVSLSALQAGETVNLHFYDEIRVPLLAHVLYEIFMTIRYDAQTQELTLTDASGSIHWKMLGSDAIDKGELATVVRGRRGEYPEKTVLNL
jgi:hypothetical protein